MVQRNYFATSYAKDKQDATGANVKQKATTAVLRRSAIIQNAKEMCENLTKEFSKPSPSSFPSRQKSVYLNRRIFFYIPSLGEHSILHNRLESRFREVKGVHTIDSVRATAQQLKVFTRSRSSYYLDCLNEDYDSCKSRALVGDWREVSLQREDSLPQTRSDEGTASAEYSLMVADLATKDSVVAVAADDPQYDYHLLKVITNGTEILQHDTVDDYGCSFVEGPNIICGHFFLRENLIDMTYKLDTKKKATVLSATIRYICLGIISRGKRGQYTRFLLLSMDKLSLLCKKKTLRKMCPIFQFVHDIRYGIMLIV